MPRVSVIIPTWNGAELLSHALDSLTRQTFRGFETIVVDNGSSDGTCEMLARGQPDVRVVRFEENRGFAPAVNAGIRTAAGEVVVLMNNDTEADPGWLAALVDALDRHPEVGSCASKMLDFEDRGRIDTAGDRLGIFASQIGHGERDGPVFARPYYVLSACGGGAAYRRSMLDEIGLFDERFFAYLEDVDLGVRAQLAGYDCLYVPGAALYHRGSATAGRMGSTKFYLLMRNSLFLFFRYMPAGRLLLWAPLMFVAPLVGARIERQPLRVGARALRDFLKEAPSVVRRRREVDATRRISRRDFRARLASPLARQNRPGGRRSLWHVAEAVVRFVSRLRPSSAGPGTGLGRDVRELPGGRAGPDASAGRVDDRDESRPDAGAGSSAAAAARPAATGVARRDGGGLADE